MKDIDIEVLDDLIKQCDQAQGKRFSKPKPPASDNPPKDK